VENISENQVPRCEHKFSATMICSEERGT